MSLAGGWINPPNGTSFTSATLADDRIYTLLFREFDDAGNVSDADAPESSFDIWADLSFTEEFLSFII